MNKDFAKADLEEKRAAAGLPLFSEGTRPMRASLMKLKSATGVLAAPEAPSSAPAGLGLKDEPAKAVYPAQGDERLKLRAASSRFSNEEIVSGLWELYDFCLKEVDDSVVKKAI